MRPSHLLFTLSLTLSLVVPAGSAPPGIHASQLKKSVKKHHHHHVIHGTVVEVTHKTSHEGSFKVQLPHHHHAKGSISAKASASRKHHYHIVTVHVNHHTKFSKVWHAAGKVHHLQAIFAELHKGEFVKVVLDHHHHAEEVDIHVKAPQVAASKLPKTIKKK